MAGVGLLKPDQEGHREEGLEFRRRCAGHGVGVRVAAHSRSLLEARVCLASARTCYSQPFSEQQELSTCAYKGICAQLKVSLSIVSPEFLHLSGNISSISIK